MFDVFEWREPLWLWLGLLPFGLWFIFRWHQKAQQQNYADAHLWPWVQASDTQQVFTSNRWFSKLLAGLTPLRFLSFAWLMWVIALAEPRQLVWEPQVSNQQAMDVMVVLDLSPSMSAKDVYPSRFLQMRQFVESFTAELSKSDRLGLVAFSGQAHLISPLTQDRALLLHFLELLEPDLLPLRGSAVEFGSLYAMQYLQQASEQTPAILVISDGRSQESLMPPWPENEAALQRLYETHFGENSALTDTKIPVVVIGVGETAQTVLADPKDPTKPWRRGDAMVSAPLGESVLQQISERLGGSYFRMQNTQKFLQQVEQALRVPSVARERAQKTWNSFSSVFLILGLIGLLCAFYPLAAWLPGTHPIQRRSLGEKGDDNE